MSKTEFRPMLAATCEDITTLKYPVLVSPKLDGIRCIIRGGVAVSRNLKPIPNRYVQERLKGLPDGLDGELIVGPSTGDDVWNRSQSGVMSADGEPDFVYHVFDLTGWDRADVSFSIRYDACKALVRSLERGTLHVDFVPHVLAKNQEEAAELEQECVAAGYEGVMIRDPNGKYKFGRSTAKEGGLLKLKRWHDAEAVVIDMVERQHNGNEATKDALGRTKRTTHKANKTGRGDMGTLLCALRTPADDAAHSAHHKTRGVALFEIGTGFTDEQRAGLWRDHKEGPPVKGRIVTFKYQSLSPEGVPRFPVFKGFRHEGDTSK